MKIHNFEQRSLEWYEARRGIPTGSNFSQVITPKTLAPCKNDFHFQLAAEIMAGADCDEWAGNAITDHGLESEPAAIAAYELETGLETYQVGFVTDDAQTMGCSPDRFVGDVGMLEIKSLFAKNMVKTYCEAQETGNCPTEYRLQVQGQLMICGREWCDLVLYHPVLDIKIIRVLPDLDIHAKLKAQIKVVSDKRDAAVLLMSGL